MDSPEYFMMPRNHLVGWIVVAGGRGEDEAKERINAGLDSFDGDYGLLREVRVSEDVGLGLLKPRNPLPLTTWSLFEERGSTCFIEGVFYDDYFSHRPVNGEDHELAKIVLRQFRETGKKAIAQLNGSFSGFIFDHGSGRLITFVDRLGVHVLYWLYENDNVAVSSNLAAFRSLKTLSLDHGAAFQFLTIGFPIDERTLLKDVMIQLPCTMNIYDGSTRQSVRYWDIPKRLKNSPLDECIETVSQSVEEHVSRIHERTRQTVCLGMSGGHDSRVVLSALAYRNIPFEPAIWKDSNFNDTVVSKLCSLLNKRPLVVRSVSPDEIEKIRERVFLYSDGTYRYAHGFLRLARECFERRINHLLLGFSGDRMSGGLTIPAPQYLRNIEQLAACTLKGQMELLSFRDALRLLGDTNNDLIEETLSEWMHSFVREGAHEHLSDVSIWQGFANRNLKRIRFSMMPAKQYVQPIFPYLDNKVLAAYMGMPIRHLNNQKAHCYAGFHRFSDFGNYRACSYPVSLKREALFPSALYLVRLSRLKIKDFLAPCRSSDYKGRWGAEHCKIYDELCRSPLFDLSILRELFRAGKFKPGDLHKIHTLSRFYDYYVLGKNSTMPQQFLGAQP